MLPNRLDTQPLVDHLTILSISSEALYPLNGLFHQVKEENKMAPSLKVIM